MRISLCLCDTTRNILQIQACCLLYISQNKQTFILFARKCFSAFIKVVFFHAWCKVGCLSVAMATATFWFQLFITLHPSLEHPPSPLPAARVTLIWSKEVVFGYWAFWVSNLLSSQVEWKAIGYGILRPIKNSFCWRSARWWGRFLSWGYKIGCKSK